MIYFMSDNNDRFAATIMGLHSTSPGNFCFIIDGWGNLAVVVRDRAFRITSGFGVFMSHSWHVVECLNNDLALCKADVLNIVESNISAYAKMDDFTLRLLAGIALPDHIDKVEPFCFSYTWDNIIVVTNGTVHQTPIRCDDYDDAAHVACRLNDILRLDKRDMVLLMDSVTRPCAAIEDGEVLELEHN